MGRGEASTWALDAFASFTRGLSEERGHPGPWAEHVLRSLALLAAARDAHEICAAFTTHGIGAMSVDACVLAHLDDDRQELVLLGGVGYTAMEIDRWRRLPLGLATPLTQAVREQRVVFVGDTDALPPDSVPTGAPKSLRAIAAVPLESGGRMLGALGLSWSEPRELSSTEAALVQLVGLQCALVMERVAAREREQTLALSLAASEQQMSGMARISKALAEAGLHEHELIDRAARAIGETFGDGCIVRLVGPDGASLPTAAVHHPDPELNEALARVAQSVGEGQCRDTVRAGKSVLLRRLHERAARAMVPTTEGAPVRSVLSAPIPVCGFTRGVVLLMRTREGAAYGNDDRVLLEDVSYRLGLALAAARSYAAEQRARERAERAAQARDRVLSIVSHDLRGPLQTLLVGASLLPDLVSITPSSDAVLSRMARAAARMQRLVSDLLDVGQLERGMLTVQRTPIDLQQVLQHCVDEHRPRADASGSRIELCVPDASILVQADGERVQQAIGNVLINAIEHTPAGTRISVRARRIEGELAEVEIEDDGPGIAPALVRSLFDAHARATGKRGGVGLGLWIAKGLIEAHGGQIHVASVRGRGTRFTLSLPLCAEREAPAARA